ncbi:hypothetical protein MHU86_23735 [Fragilaria crotonensis]|nr:hypothetical protein MHU86_23735 [Fragilaria crotonensis]
MQQYLVLCAGVEHEDEINPALLEFRSTRQQLEDGAFVFPACDFKERLGHDRRTSVDRAVPGAHAPPLVRRDAAQQENKIRTLCICLLPAFVAQPSQWAFDQERSTAEFHNRRHVGRPGLYRNLPPETVPREPTRTNLLAPATSPTPRISRQPATTRHETKSGLERYAPALDSPPTDHSVARALSPGDAHDAPTSALADTPRPLPGKFPSLVPLPTIPLPNVDSPFPRLPEPRLADALATILHSGQPRTHATEFRFDWTHDAARHNLAVLKRSASPKGEFPLREISDSDRLADVRANLARGNHKSARGHEAKLISMLKDEASRVGSYHREKPP